MRLYAYCKGQPSFIYLGDMVLLNSLLKQKPLYQNILFHPGLLMPSPGTAPFAQYRTRLTNAVMA